MKSISTKHDSSQPVTDTAVYLFDDWFDPIEACVRERVREFIGAMIEGELDATLLRPRYERLPKNAAGAPAAVGHRHGHRARSLIGTFGRTEIEVPRARLNGPDGKTTEWNSQVLPGLPAPHAGGRCVNCQHLFGRHQHAPGAPRLEGAVRRRRGGGYGEPGVAAR